MFLQAILLKKWERKNIETVWILMDNQSKADVFGNPHLVKNISHV